MQPIFDKILSLSKEIFISEQARDRLLSKLMSGELEVLVWKKDLTNSRLDRQNILKNEMAIEEIQNKSGVEGIVSIEGCID